MHLQNQLHKLRIALFLSGHSHQAQLTIPAKSSDGSAEFLFSAGNLIQAALFLLNLTSSAGCFSAHLHCSPSFFFVVSDIINLWFIDGLKCVCAGVVVVFAS